MFFHVSLPAIAGGYVFTTFRTPMCVGMTLVLVLGRIFYEVA